MYRPHLPGTNADGLPVIPLTEEQRYTFDLNGWLLFPGVLSNDDIEEMREFCDVLKKEPETISDKDGSSMGGPLERLTDHPVVVGLMQEFLSNPAHEGDDSYGFRMELTFLAYRFGSLATDLWYPHGGRGAVPRADSGPWPHAYRLQAENAYCGLTQAVWELNPVRKGDGTHFVSGSHKSCYGFPENIMEQPEHSLWETYECPAGSLLFFTESLGHSGTKWTNKDWDRIAIFNSYNAIDCKYHDWEPHPEHVAAMPPKRRSLFRDVRAEFNVPGKTDDQRIATRFGEDGDSPSQGKAGGRGMHLHPDYRPVNASET